MTQASSEQSTILSVGVQRPKLRALVLGLLSSLFLVCSFPPIGFWICAFLVPLPLFVLALDPVISARRAGMYAAIGMIPAQWWLHQWIGGISMLGLYPLVIYLSLYTWIFVWIASRTIQRWSTPLLVLPIVWVGIEFARGVVIWSGYPWYFIGHPLIDPLDGLLAAPAAMGGVYLVSFLVASISAAALVLMSSKQRVLPAISIAAVLVIWTASALPSVALRADNASDAEIIRVGVVQPDVPQDNRMDWTTRQRVSDWLTLRNLTYQVARLEPTPDVIVWPEGFVPGWTLDPDSLQAERDANVAWSLAPKHDNDAIDLDLPGAIGATTVVDEMLLMQESLQIPMIVGSVAFDNLRILKDDGIEYKHDAMYNSAFVLHDGAAQPVWYDKLHLTPFGEVMPYISAWPWLEKQLLSFGAQGMTFVLSPGKEARVLTIPTNINEISIATPICFEATMPAVCKKLVYQSGQRRAPLMINITNDGWFGASTAGRKSHELMARWRCVELSTPMVRCANTGISGVIDRRGQIITPEFVVLDDGPPDRIDRKAGGFVASVRLAQGTTLFGRIGDAFGWIVFATMLLSGFVLKKQRSASKASAYAENTDKIQKSETNDPENA